MCSNGSFSRCHGNGSQKLIKNRGKWPFVIFVILKCDLPPINTPQGINMLIKIFLALFLINSRQFYMIKMFWGLKYSPLKMTIESIHRWLKMIYFIRSVSDHGKCSIKLKFSTREFVNVYFGIFQWLPWQRQSELVKNNKTSAFP